jgi:hypothetical protein
MKAREEAPSVPFIVEPVKMHETPGRAVMFTLPE